MTSKEIRVQAKKSRAWVAVMAGVSEPTVRLFEVDPLSIETKSKRDSITEVYASLKRDLDNKRTL